jgi:branched-chain amino acid transport system substrate-binding protein
MMSWRQLAGWAAVWGAFGTAPALAEISDGVVKIGVLSDMAGVYSDITGKGSVFAAQLAVQDCLKAECTGLKVEVLSADHQNKADVASNIAREWIDRQGVDVLADMSHASIQLALPPLLKDKNRVGLFPGGTARLTATPVSLSISCSGCGTPTFRSPASRTS